MKQDVTLDQALHDANVQAFLRVIRAGEGTSDDEGYRRMFGGSLFFGYDDHPRQAHTAGRWTSTAAGAYQFLSSTWDECARELKLTDFSPASQDLAAVYLIRRRGALDDVLASRVEQAIAKCAREWASLPGSPYGQPTRSLAQALEAYRAAGGQSTPTPSPEASMEPFTLAAFTAITEVVPSLIRLFGGGGETTERNAQAAELVVDVAKKATGASNEQELVQALKTDPAAVQQVQQAVRANMASLMDLLLRAGEADERSRGAAFDRNLQLGKATGGRWLWLLGGVALLVVLASYGITAAVLFGAGFTPETKALLLGQIVIAGFVAVLAFLFGSNIQNRISDAARAQQDRA